MFVNSHKVPDGIPNSRPLPTHRHRVFGRCFAVPTTEDENALAPLRNSKIGRVQESEWSDLVARVHQFAAVSVTQCLMIAEEKAPDIFHHKVTRAKLRNQPSEG
jgi:hypothetical protein